jgi:hypothetical protein
MQNGKKPRTGFVTDIMLRVLLVIILLLRVLILPRVLIILRAEGEEAQHDHHGPF